MAEHNEIGKIGEKISRTFLMKHSFNVHDTNYRTKFGEIDIVAEKDGILRFIEVKSVKVRTVDSWKDLVVQPEDNMTRSKWTKFVTTVELYLKNKGVTHETRWQVDLACVYIDTEKREGRVILKQNIHME